VWGAPLTQSPVTYRSVVALPTSDTSDKTVSTSRKGQDDAIHEQCSCHARCCVGERAREFTITRDRDGLVATPVVCAIFGIVPVTVPMITNINNLD
jgi:hypothetical protein